MSATTEAAERLWEDWAHAFLERNYGMRGRLERLPGENRNYRVQDAGGRRAVLKVASAAFPPEVVALEHAAVEHLHAMGLPWAMPRTIPAADGAVEGALPRPDGTRQRARLLEWVPGVPWRECDAIRQSHLRSLGGGLARLSAALEDFEHPAMRRSHRWDLQALDPHRASVALVGGPRRRALLERAFHLWACCARPRLQELPRQLVHGDANEENLLVDAEGVTGLLDFGDALEAPRVVELAVALAYVMLDREQPLEAAAQVAAAFQELRPLEDAERAVLLPLVAGRLATSCAVAAERRRADPEHPHWFATEERAWRSLERLLAIDPAVSTSTLLGERTAGGGTSTEELVADRRRHLNPALSIGHGEPLHMVRGEGAVLHDVRGRPFLDLVNNVCHVGHCHPRVVAAGQAQMARLNTNSRYVYPQLTEYAERLAATLPEPLEVVFLVNSGSEANELALRLARTHTGASDVIVVDGAYHGNTGALIAISPYKFRGRGGSGAAPEGVHVVPMPDGYRGVHRGFDRATGEAYGDEVGAVIRGAGRPIAAFIAEPLLGCGGQVVPPPGTFARAFEHVRTAGGVCIADEVQVGFGRVGTHFWAFEQHGVVPDVVVLGKPIGNGHPMAAVVTTRAVAESFRTGMEFFSTFGGNPVSCAIGLAVLDVLEEEGLQEHARTLGAHFLAGLGELVERHAIAGTARGVGLFLGLELVRDPATREPATEEVARIVDRMRERGVLLSTDGPHANVLKIKPPLVVDRPAVDMVLRCLGDELSEFD